MSRRNAQARGKPLDIRFCLAEYGDLHCLAAEIWALENCCSPLDGAAVRDASLASARAKEGP
jgi:hypothetical protein